MCFVGHISGFRAHMLMMKMRAYACQEKQQQSFFNRLHSEEETQKKKSLISCFNCHLFDFVHAIFHALFHLFLFSRTCVTEYDVECCCCPAIAIIITIVSTNEDWKNFQRRLFLFFTFFFFFGISLLICLSSFADWTVWFDSCICDSLVDVVVARNSCRLYLCHCICSCCSCSLLLVLRFE